MAQMIFVTNRNDFHHVDMFDGVAYEFAPMEKIAIPIDAARHMFGFGLEDKTETLVRLGWAMKYDPAKKTFVENEEGVKHLARFVFTKAVMVEEEIKSVPAPDNLEIV